MSPYSDIQFLRNARLGGVLTPNELRAEIQHVPATSSRIGRYAVYAQVPSWLVDLFNPTQKLSHTYSIYPTLDGRDRLFVAVLQCNDTQLRLVLRASDPLVQSFLVDALANQVLTVLFLIEHTRQCALLGAPLDLADQQSVLVDIRSATLGAYGYEPVLQLTSMNCDPAFVPSLIDGHAVQNVMAIVAGAPTPAELDASRDSVRNAVQEAGDAMMH